MDNNVTFVIVEIHYKNVHLWNLQIPFLVHYSLQLPLSAMCQHLIGLKLDDF